MRVVVYAIVALIVTGMIIVMVGPALAAPVGGAGAVGGVEITKIGRASCRERV